MSAKLHSISLNRSDIRREVNAKIFKCVPNGNLSIGSADVTIIGGYVSSTNSKESTQIAAVSRSRFFSGGPEFKVQHIPSKRFITGSSYVGEWNVLGFCGEGTYRFPHGVIYKGEFNREGDFHGIGTLLFTGGGKIRGMWKNGRLLSDTTYIYRGGEVMQECYKYCQMPDRRFFIEIEDELNPAGQEYLTDSPLPRQLPPGTYDVADGVYEPATDRILVDMTESTIGWRGISPEYSLQRLDKTSDYSLLVKDDIGKDRNYYKNRMSTSYEFDRQVCREIPSWAKKNWILEHCRKAEDEPVGYRPELYEIWMAGRRREAYNCFIEDSSSVDDFLIPEKVKNKEAVSPSPFYSFIRKSSYKKWKSDIAGNRKTFDIKAPSKR